MASASNFTAKTLSGSNHSFFDFIHEYLNLHLEKMNEKYSFDFQRDHPNANQNSTSNYRYYKENTSSLTTKTAFEGHLIAEAHSSSLEKSKANPLVIFPKEKGSNQNQKIKKLIKKRVFKINQKSKPRRQLRYNSTECQSVKTDSTKEQ